MVSIGLLYKPDSMGGPSLIGDRAKPIARNIRFTIALVLVLGISSHTGVLPLIAQTSPDLSSLADRLDLHARVITEAQSRLGTPYLFAGTSPRGFDCSGFVFWVFSQALGMDLPRSTSAQARIGRPVERQDLQKGDLVFFITVGNDISHVGIYDGEGNIIHAASEGPQTGVIISSLSERYYDTRYALSRRVLPDLVSLAQPESLSQVTVPIPQPPGPTQTEAALELLELWSTLAGIWQGDRGLREVQVFADGTGVAIMDNRERSTMKLRIGSGAEPGTIRVYQDEPNAPHHYTALVNDRLARQLAEQARPMAWEFTLDSQGSRLTGIKETTFFRQFADSITSIDNDFVREAVWTRRR